MSLKNDLIVEINGKILQQCTFLLNNFDKKFLYYVTLILHEKIVIPEEIIFRERELNNEDKSLFYV